MSKTICFGAGIADRITRTLTTSKLAINVGYSDGYIQVLDIKP